METIIKIRSSELNIKLFDKIKSFIGGNKNIDITISLKEPDPYYAQSLDNSISEAKNNEIISMTMEEFIDYVPKK